MTITKEYLLEQVSEYKKQLEQVQATGNAIVGAIQSTEALIAYLAKTEPSDEFKQADKVTDIASKKPLK